jgi:hypothetical protein
LNEDEGKFEMDTWEIVSERQEEYCEYDKNKAEWLIHPGDEDHFPHVLHNCYDNSTYSLRKTHLAWLPSLSDRSWLKENWKCDVCGKVTPEEIRTLVELLFILEDLRIGNAND